MLLKDAGDGKSLMVRGEVKRANSDLESESFSFHVIDKRWHYHVLRILSFYRLLESLKTSGMLSFILNNAFKNIHISYQHLTGLTCSEIMQLSHHTIKTHECTFSSAISDCQLQTITVEVYRKEDQIFNFKTS